MVLRWVIIKPQKPRSGSLSVLLKPEDSSKTRHLPESRLFPGRTRSHLLSVLHSTFMDTGLLSLGNQKGFFFLARFKYKNFGGSSLLCKMGLCLHITYTHPTIYFKSSLDCL